MILDNPSSPSLADSNPIGRDGWLTLLLSTFIIILSGGLSLIWQSSRVVRYAHRSTSGLNDRIELVLVPGVQLEHDMPSFDYYLRLRKACALYRQHGALLLLMGGTTGESIVTEAQAGRQSLLEQGVTADAIILEDSSRNTLENLCNARDKLRTLNIKHIALVSNRYHLARCEALANGLGLTLHICAAEDKNRLPLKLWPRLLLEAYYLHWYHTGRIWSRLTRNRHSLARIS